MERVKVVAHYLDGAIVKGFTHNFYPSKPSFHLSPLRGRLTPPIDVQVRDLKAVFFVRRFEGDPRYNERKCFLDKRQPPGLRVEVTFTDGETLVGSTLSYNPRHLGFFFVPADPLSNNLRVFAISPAAANIRLLEPDESIRWERTSANKKATVFFRVHRTVFGEREQQILEMKERLQQDLRRAGWNVDRNETDLDWVDTVG